MAVRLVSGERGDWSLAVRPVSGARGNWPLAVRLVLGGSGNWAFVFPGIYKAHLFCFSLGFFWEGTFGEPFS